MCGKIVLAFVVFLSAGLHASEYHSKLNPKFIIPEKVDVDAKYAAGKLPIIEVDPHYQAQKDVDDGLRPPLIAIDPLWIQPSLDENDDGVMPPMIEVDPVWIPPIIGVDPLYQAQKDVDDGLRPPLIAIDPLWIQPSPEANDDGVMPPMIEVDPVWIPPIIGVDPLYQAQKDVDEGLRPPLIAIDPLWIQPSPEANDDGVMPPMIEIDPVWIPELENHNLAESGKPPASRDAICTIGTKNSNELSMTQPILVNPSTGKIFQPSSTGVLQFNAGEVINMYCTGSFIEPLHGKKLAATCVEDKMFSINGQNLEITQISCNAMAAHLLRKTPRTCYQDAVIIEIGFAVVDDFFPLLEICHNMEKQVTHYSHYPMGPYNAGYQSGIPRPLFMTGGFFNMADVNAMYTQVQQKLAVDKILGYDSSNYFDISNNVYMARGHMCAKVDLVYAPAQWATFYFLNTAPQWQTFNGGNWERVENGVRTMVGNRNVHLDVYTGTWGVMTLPDINGDQKELYLHFDKNGNGLIPVPKIYYRVIIDVETKLGLVLIGVNNIHATMKQLEEEYIICTDVSDQLDWVPWDKENLLRGYSYACEVNEFAERIGELPPLQVSGLFT